MKEYNHRWYVLGWVEEQKSIQIYALDRIEKLQTLQFKPFKPNVDWDVNTYFNDIIGVTHIARHPQPDIFRICIQKPRAYYVRTKKWHPSQQEVVETIDAITFEWTLKFNRELESHTLHYMNTNTSCPF